MNIDLWSKYGEIERMAFGRGWYQWESIGSFLGYRDIYFRIKSKFEVGEYDFIDFEVQRGCSNIWKYYLNFFN